VPRKQGTYTDSFHPDATHRHVSLVIPKVLNRNANILYIHYSFKNSNAYVHESMDLWWP
jgi:hypothetical protein